MGRLGGYPAADKLFAFARSLAIALALLVADNPRTSHLLDTIAPCQPFSKEFCNKAFRSGGRQSRRQAVCVSVCV